MIVKYKPIEIANQSLWVCFLKSLTLAVKLVDFGGQTR